MERRSRPEGERRSRPWTYYPGFFQTSSVLKLVQELKDWSRPAVFRFYGKTTLGKRISCAFSDQKEGVAVYRQTPIRKWKEAPKEVRDAREKIERELGHRIDYVLVHIYRNQDDKIAWHFDREGNRSEIFSLSLGETRRFILKSKSGGDKKEYYLKNGDLIHMHGPREGKKGCQDRYIHTLAPMMFTELKTYLRKKGVTRKFRTKKEASDYIREHHLEPLRVNMTFRQFQ